MAAPAPAARRISAVAFLAIMLVGAALIFLLIWVLVSPSSPFWALIGIGWTALLFGLIAYLAQAFTPNPVLGRATALGFGGMGFTVLAVTIALFPAGSGVSVVTRIILALLLLVALAVAVLGMYYGAGRRVADARREVARENWRSQPTTSAFDYGAAHQAPTPPINNPPPRTPGPPGGGT